MNLFKRRITRSVEVAVARIQAEADASQRRATLDAIAERRRADRERAQAEFDRIGLPRNGSPADKAL